MDSREVVLNGEVESTLQSEIYDSENEINWFNRYYPVYGKSSDKLINLKENLLVYDNYGKFRHDVKFLNFSYFLRSRNGWVKLKSLNLTWFDNLVFLDCSSNSLTILDLRDLNNLESLDFSCNKVSELFLPLNNRIRKINASNNSFDNFSYDYLNPFFLKELLLSENNLTGDISFFSNLINLESLYFDNNNFYGSFNSLYKLDKLSVVSFFNNPIIPSFEWLNESVVYWYNENDSKLKPFYVNTAFKSLINLSSDDRNVFFIKIIFEKIEDVLENIKKEMLLIDNNDNGVLSDVLKDEYNSIENLFNVSRNKFYLINKLSEYEVIRDNLELSFRKDQNQQFYWTRSQKCEEVLTNANNGFRLWLDSEILFLKKLRLNFYWDLIKNEGTFDKEQFEYFFQEYC